MGLEITELTELLTAIVEPARERFLARVNDFMSPDITMLGETFAAEVADVRSVNQKSDFDACKMRSELVIMLTVHQCDGVHGF
jgi:hypothetical protein